MGYAKEYGAQAVAGQERQYEEEKAEIERRYNNSGAVGILELAATSPESAQERADLRDAKKNEEVQMGYAKEYGAQAVAGQERQYEEEKAQIERRYNNSGAVGILELAATSPESAQERADLREAKENNEIQMGYAKQYGSQAVAGQERQYKKEKAKIERQYQTSDMRSEKPMKPALRSEKPPKPASPWVVQ